MGSGNEIEQKGKGKRWLTICLCSQQKENNISRVPCLVSCTERFPLAVQIVFQKKQMLRALREFLKCRAGAEKFVRFVRKPIRDNPKIFMKSEKIFLKSEKIFQIVMFFGNHH